MKSLIFIAILLVLTVTVFGQGIRYDKLVILQKGDDCFTFDSKATKVESGEIILNSTSLRVGNKSFTIRKRLSGTIIKAKGCDIEYIYRNKQLVALKIVKAATNYYYIIDNSAVAGKN